MQKDRMLKGRRVKMRKKSWVTIIIGLILIALGCAAFYSFGFTRTLTEHSQAWKFEAGKLRELTIAGDAKRLDIRFVASDDGKDTVTLEGKEEKEVSERLTGTTLQDGKLELNLKPKFRLFSLNFDFSQEQQTIVVALSDAERLADFTVKSDSGSVTVDGAKAQTISIRSDSGALKASGIEAGTLSLKADSGSVRLSGLKAEQATIKTDSGSIQADGGTAEVTATSDSGSIKLNGWSGGAKIKTDSGSVQLLKKDTASADIKTDSGSVRVELPPSFAGTYDLRSDSGSIRAPESPGKTDDTIKARTDSGSIRIVIPE